MAELTKDELKDNINNELADNNAGNISAYDVRHNMIDIVDSIVPIIQSGINIENPFVGNVKVGQGDENGGILEVTSGVRFPDGNLQTKYFPGIDGIEHSGLAGLTAGDPHTQYFHINGSRNVTGNAGFNAWVSESGIANQGVKFDDEQGLVRFGNKAEKPTTLKFDRDSTQVDTFKGVAKAWISFTASSGVSNSGVAVKSSYNVHTLRRVGAGQFQVTFPENTFSDNNYVMIGNSSGRGDADTADAFDINVVGTVSRTGDDNPTLRTASFYVMNLSNQYVNAAVNDIVVFGNGNGASYTATVNIVDDLGIT